jgi:putative FmdB family regulatory protein
MKLEAIQPASYGGIAFGKLASLGFARDFEDAQPESSTRCHNGAVEKKPARCKVLFEIARMLVHHAPFLHGDILGKRGAGRNEFEVIVLLGHGAHLVSGERSSPNLALPWIFSQLLSQRCAIIQFIDKEARLPLYEYKCKKCGRRTEKIQKFSDPPLATCETCGGDIERLLSSSAIQFKGSGWYVTDYARKSSAPGSGAAAESSASTEKKEPEKKETAKPSEPAKVSPGKD